MLIKSKNIGKAIKIIVTLPVNSTLPDIAEYPKSLQVSEDICVK